MNVVNKDGLATNIKEKIKDLEDKSNSIAALVRASSFAEKTSSYSVADDDSNSSSLPTNLGQLVSLRVKNMQRSRAHDDPLRDWLPVNAPPDLFLLREYTLTDVLPFEQEKEKLRKSTNSYY